MKVWQEVCHFGDGIVFACGNERKLVIPNCPVIYFNTDTKKVRWRPSTSNSKPARINEAKRNE